MGFRQGSKKLCVKASSHPIFHRQQECSGVEAAESGSLFPGEDERYEKDRTERKRVERAKKAREQRGRGGSRDG